MPIERALSTHVFINQRLTVSLLERIEKAGIGLLEIFCARQHLDYHDHNQVVELAAWFRENKLQLHSLHTPLYRDLVWGRSGPQARVSIAEMEKVRRIEAVDEIKRALEVAEHIPFRYAIVHVGLSDEEYDERKMDAALWSVEHLRLFGRQRGVSLVLENTPNELSTPERLLGLIHTLRFPDLGVCFDSGHAHMTAGGAGGKGARGVFEKLKALVCTTHLHDNMGDKDDHLFPFDGQIDWSDLAQAFRAAPHSFPWLLEIREFPELKDPLGKALEVFQRLEELGNA